MFITAELLRKYNACQQDIQFVENFYPNGTEMIEIIKDPRVTKETLHWGRNHLTSNSKELEEYCKVCNIVNSENFWYSNDIQDSKYIIKSHNINSSLSVFNSSDVNYSTDIVQSEGVDNSEQIFYSSIIDSCKQIYRGENIVSSINICNSQMVAHSANIIQSTNIFNSSEISRSNNVTNSYFCNDCVNIEHCMFCQDLQDASYYIFNKPISKERYELFEQQYKKYMTVALNFIQAWPKELIIETSVIPTQKFDQWYLPIPEKFWKWVRTLPNFDSMIIYNITMLPKILID